MSNLEANSGHAREPFTIRIGDVFGDRKGINKSVRVILGLGFGSIAVSAAVPAVRGGMEYFSAIGSTHLLTEVRPVIDHWNWDRIIAAYREGAKIQWEPLPETSREELIQEFIDSMRTSEKERLVTVADLEAAQAYEIRQQARWKALDEEFELK
jgi:hypothetical protein